MAAKSRHRGNNVKFRECVEARVRPGAVLASGPPVRPKSAAGLPALWQPARRVENTQDLDGVSFDTIRHYVAGPRDHELAGTGNAPRSAESRLICQLGDSLENSRHDEPCSRRIIVGAISSFLVQVAQRRAQPANPHLLPLPCEPRDILLRGKIASIRLLYGGANLRDLPFIVFDELADRFCGQKRFAPLS